jgi:hypothetical protein
MIKRGKAEKWAARSERLAAALRENLKRRKAQARGRAAGMAGQADAQGEDFSAEDATMETGLPDFRRNRGRE